MSGRIVTPEMLAAFAVEYERVLNEPDRGGQLSYARRVVTIEPGLRYARIVVRDADRQQGSGSAYGFIDLTNGCVLKSATWKKPDPVPRGNLLDGIDPTHGRMAMGRWGIRYLDDAALDRGVVWALRVRYAPETITPDTRRPAGA